MNRTEEYVLKASTDEAICKVFMDNIKRDIKSIKPKIFIKRGEFIN
jgi:hypothetical protein